MFKTKTLTGILLVLAVLFMQVGTVFAAPATQETSISGKIVDVEPSTADAEGVTTYLVTVQDEVTGETQIVRVSQDTAATLGLLEKDPVTGELVLDPTTGEPIVDESQFGEFVTIASDQVILDEEPDEEPFNPVAGFLADYFGVTNATINDFHEDGFGFGVIAQALWISTDDAGITDPVLAGDILTAKQEKSFDTFFLNHPEYDDLVGDNPPTNWGQFKKLLSDKHENLGSAVPGHAGDTVEESATTLQEHGKGQNNNKGKGKGHGHGKP